MLRSSIPDAELVARVKQEIGAMDPTLPVEIQTMDERLSDLAAGPRFYAVLLIVFAANGLLLAAVGLYGTISYLVTQRKQEIGIRMSMGATPAAIGRLMLAYSARWTLIGSAVGVLAAIATTGLLRSLLFRVSVRDPLTLTASFLFLLLTALLATLGPALRAASVDPADALRSNN